MAKIYYRLVPYLSIRCLSSCTGLCEGYQVFSLRLCLIQPVNVSNCPALISDESAGLSDAYCLSVCQFFCLSVCLQLYAFGNRMKDRSEILGNDLVRRVAVSNFVKINPLEEGVYS